MNQRQFCEIIRTTAWYEAKAKLQIISAAHYSESAEDLRWWQELDNKIAEFIDELNEMLE